MSDKDILILGIESSCDETAAAVVKNGRNILSNVISSQIDIHTLYGGVVPEIASRKHIERINYVIEEALEKANMIAGSMPLKNFKGLNPPSVLTVREYTTTACTT